MFKIKYLYLFVYLLCALLLALPVRADFTFGAFGDTPYSDDEEQRFPSLIAEMNREPLAFVVHVGDFKSGWSACTDELFELRREQFGWFHHPLIYVPGDNEWTDCHRAFGARRDPLERLQKLRALFAKGEFSMGQRRIPLERQSESFPEHARWRQADVLFATLNVPGGNNVSMPQEARVRGESLQAWVSRTFATAREQKLRAVVLVMQANPFLDDGRIGRFYTDVMAVIERETLGYGGEVLLIHGDTHRYRLDQPLFSTKLRQRVRNFTRVEVHGYPFMNWVRIRVNTSGARVTFTAMPGF